MSLLMMSLIIHGIVLNMNVNLNKSSINYII